MKGVLISLEGLDGSGKSTQAKLLVDRLNRSGIDCVYVREPGGTLIGEEVRNVLIQNRDEGSVPCKETEVLLYMASRMQLIHEKIKPYLDNGTHVIADRFIDSTIAMQGVARGQLEMVGSLVDLLMKDFKPLRTFYLNIPVKFQEKSFVGRELDRLESEGKHFHNAVEMGFKMQIERDPNRFRMIDVTDNNNFRDMEVIHNEIFYQTIKLLQG